MKRTQGMGHGALIQREPRWPSWLAGQRAEVGQARSPCDPDRAERQRGGPADGSILTILPVLAWHLVTP